MTPNALAAAGRYRTVSVTTCSPGQLLVMLYDGLFRFLNEAQRAMLAQNRPRAGESIGKSHAILEELLATLDPNITAPALYDSLSGLYRFCMGRLIEANIKQDATRIADVIRLLTPVREAWKMVVNGT